MATLSELRISIQEKLDDPSYTDAQLDTIINRGYRRCAYVVLLPDLEAIGTFTTDPLTNRVQIPADWNFSRNLYHAHVAGGPNIQVFSSIDLLRRQVPNIDTAVEEGNVQYIALHKGEIVYHRSPTEATLVPCKFFEAPELVVADEDTPLALPPELHEPLLVNYALYNCFESIEDGIEGSKVNTLHYKNAWLEALGDLSEMFDRGQSTPDPYRDSSWI